MEHFTSYTDFTLFPEQQQSFTDVEGVTAYVNEFDRLTVDHNAKLTFAYKATADFEYGHDRQRAVQQAWQEVRVARQTLIDHSIQQAEFPPLFDDAEQSGEIYDNGEGEYHQCPLVACATMEQEQEDCNPIKEKYMQGFPVHTFNLLLTEPLSPETPAAIERKTAPNSSTGSANHEDRGGAPLTPEQIDQLLIFWGNSELVEQHHHSRLIGDLEREARITAVPFLDEDKLALILDWRDGLPIR